MHKLDLWADSCSRCGQQTVQQASIPKALTSVEASASALAERLHTTPTVLTCSWLLHHAELRPGIPAASDNEDSNPLTWDVDKWCGRNNQRSDVCNRNETVVCAESQQAECSCTAG